MQPRPPRPTGITILAILAILVGLGALALGGFLLAASAIVGTLNLSATYPQLAAYNLTTATIAAILAIAGAVFLILGILDIVVGAGFLGGKGWARTLGMIVAVLNIIGGIFGIITAGPGGGVVFLIAWIAILYYLTRPRVKAFFGKAPWTPPSMGAPTMGTGTMTSMGSSSTGATMIRCSSCGAMAPAGTMTCPSCGASL